MGSGFSKMKKQARLLQEQFSTMQQKMKETQVEGIAANGLVKVIMDGEKAVKSISIDKSIVDPSDVDGLQDLILTALEDAHTKASELSSSGLPSGLPFGL